MAMVVQHNIQAMNANRNLGLNSSSLSKSSEKLSSGYKINRAGDDAAGLSISEKMRKQIRGLQKASTNAQDGISLIQTAEGALNEVHSILQRINELAVQAANGTNTNDERSYLNDEVTELKGEIDRIATTTEFNGMTLLNGTAGGSNNGKVTLQIGANKGQTLVLEMSKKMTTASLGINSTKINGVSAAQSAIAKISTALKKVSEFRSKLGAYQNRLEHTINNLDVAAENLSAAESRIRDTDMASEMVKYSSSNILNQAAQSMLAQANQSQQSVLSLLQ